MSNNSKLKTIYEDIVYLFNNCGGECDNCILSKQDCDKLEEVISMLGQKLR